MGEKNANFTMQIISRDKIDRCLCGRSRAISIAFLLSVWVGVSATRSSAQDLERFAPQMPKAEHEGEVIESPTTPEEEADKSIELLPSLKGLVFVPRPSDVRESGRPGVKGVIVENVPLMDEETWSTRLADRFGAPLSMGGLHEIMREIINDYRDKGRPVVDVVVMEQDITSGVIQLAVVEAKVGQIQAEGAKWFKPDRLTSQVRLEHGGPIDSTILMADLAWLNKNPFRSIDLMYSPGEGEEETDVILRVEDRFPMRVYVGGENSGNILTGRDRWYAGINYGNLWDLDHQINYQWTFNDNIDQLSAHALSYIAPLPWRHTLSFQAAYVESEAALPAPFNLKGETAQLSGRYTIPLPGKANLSHEVEFGYDFKYSTSNLEFGVLTALAIATDVHQFVGGYRARLRDKGGVTGVSAFAFLSPGDVGGGNRDTAFNLARAGAKSSYTYGRFDLDRLQKLPRGFTFALRASGQVSNRNLLPSEQMGMGGYTSIRGYEEYELNVDQGYLLSTELRTPTIPVPIFASDNAGKASEAQFLVFLDHGGGRNVNLLPGEPNSLSMTSIGPGLRWSVGDSFSLRFDYGFQLEDSGAGLNAGNSRGHLGVQLAW